MRSKIYVLMLMLFVSQFAFSQRAKLNPSLYREVIKENVSTRIVSLLVQGNVSSIKQKLRSLGGVYKYSVNDISSVTLPLNKIKELAEEKDIERIEGLGGNGVMLDEITLINANITAVHLGYSPLTQPYDGAGVVMGFLDSGIDFTHGDFKNADGTTRIKNIWDQTVSTGGSTPLPYNYGQEWDAAAIDGGQCVHVEVYGGHGSNVSGIGAGNGLAINNFKGVAPASDIIAVSILFNENFLTNVADGAEYIYNKAAALGKPCVINASLGTYFGSHDGTDLAAQLIDNLITQTNGRSFVCAAGNAGQNGINPPSHLGYQTQPDSSFTWFYYNNALGEVFYEWWVDDTAATNFNFAIGADINNPFTFYGRTEYLNLINDFDYSNGYASKDFSLYHDATFLGDINIISTKIGNSYAVDVTIFPSLTTYYWRFITNGTGRFDAWSANGLIGTSDMIWSGLPSSSEFPDIDRYKSPDYNQTIVSSFNCSDKVITVGNYTNRVKYFDFYGNEQIIANDTTGKLATSSSWGPSRDGKIKPEVAAPGNTTLATGQIVAVQALIIAQPYKVALGGMHNRNGGTSMAAPVVAGVAALYLQKNPQASWKEIKDAIETTTYTDDFTGNNLPDNKFGYGKVNAFAALTSVLIYGCTVPFSINFDPQATVDDGSCEPIVFGCNDANALNFNPDANMNDGTCTYGVGMETLVTENNFFNCYPNPASSFTTFYFNNEAGKETIIIISDLQGKTIDEVSVTNSQNYFVYKEQLPAGVYICRLQNNLLITKSIKLLVY
ncbi:MAG: S8 family peptidase [Chitinophagales bacterium]|nr:S8 family peptidase [Chitinophagales bacterium]